MNSTIRNKATHLTLAISTLDLTDWRVYHDGRYLDHFRQLRACDPVHYSPDSSYGPFWSITRFDDITAVEKNTGVFSSEASIGGFIIYDESRMGLSGFAQEFMETARPFMGTDPPEHTSRRRPVAVAFTNERMARIEAQLKRHVTEIFDGLDLHQPFNWVVKVANELPGRMLADLLSIESSSMRQLLELSRVITGLCFLDRGLDGDRSTQQASQTIMNCAELVLGLREARKAGGGEDLISILASGSRNALSDIDFFNDITVFVIGALDTTASALTGGVIAFDGFPSELAKLRSEPDLLNDAVSEIIRWQTPLHHMRRTAIDDFRIGGKTIAAGDKVVLWYASGNRDEDVFPAPELFQIDRSNVRRHLSFGTGVHRCVGNRIAEMQVRLVWQEIIARDLQIEIVEPPERFCSCFVNGYHALQVRLVPRKGHESHRSTPAGLRQLDVGGACR